MCGIAGGSRGTTAITRTSARKARSTSCRSAKSATNASTIDCRGNRCSSTTSNGRREKEIDLMTTTERTRHAHIKRLFIERFGVFAYDQLVRGRAKTETSFYRFVEEH